MFEIIGMRRIHSHHGRHATGKHNGCWDPSLSSLYLFNFKLGPIILKKEYSISKSK